MKVMIVMDVLYSTDNQIIIDQWAKNNYNSNKNNKNNNKKNNTKVLNRNILSLKTTLLFLNHFKWSREIKLKVKVLKKESSTNTYKN